MKDNLWIFGDSYGAYDSNWIKDLGLTLNCTLKINNRPGTSFNWSVKQFSKVVDKIKPNDRVLFLISEFSRFTVHLPNYDDLYCSGTEILSTKFSMVPPQEVVKAIKSYQKHIMYYEQMHLDHLIQCKWLQEKLEDVTKFNCMIHTISDPTADDYKSNLDLVQYKPHIFGSFYEFQSAFYNMYTDSDSSKYTEHGESIRKQIIKQPNHWVNENGFKEAFYSKYNNALNRLAESQTFFGSHNWDK